MKEGAVHSRTRAAEGWKTLDLGRVGAKAQGPALEFGPISLLIFKASV